MQSNSLEGANAEGTVLADGCGECLHHHMVCEVCPKCHKKPDSSTRLYVDIRHDLIQEKWQQALASERRRTDNGRTYTRQQLFLLYGERGLAMWEAAAAEHRAAEHRVSVMLHGMLHWVSDMLHDVLHRLPDMLHEMLRRLSGMLYDMLHRHATSSFLYATLYATSASRYAT